MASNDRTSPQGDEAVPGDAPALDAFRSDVIDRIRAAGGAWRLAGGQLVLPRVFGFCRGVKRALAMLQRTVSDPTRRGQTFTLLGEIIHNPWVNDYFRSRGVRVLSRRQRGRLEEHLTAGDCAVIPAFGVPLSVERRLAGIACGVLDCTCGDVRRLWIWSERAVGDGFGVLIFGKPSHDETVVTKSRLRAAGGKYLVAEDLTQVDRFLDMIAAGAKASPGDAFGDQATNAESIDCFRRLAQVSQTTMLYEETMEVRRRVRSTFLVKFGQEALAESVLFEPTVCRATQDRQTAAVDLCRSGCDLVMVVGGFGSSNTRNLHRLARGYAPAFLIEDSTAIGSGRALETIDPETGEQVTVRDWLPERRPLRVGVLAGASSPEVVVGEVLEKLAGFLS